MSETPTYKFSFYNFKRMSFIFENFRRIISTHSDELTVNRDKSVLRRLISPNSNRQIQFATRKYEKNQFILFLANSNGHAFSRRAFVHLELIKNRRMIVFPLNGCYRSNPEELMNPMKSREVSKYHKKKFY